MKKLSIISDKIKDDTFSYTGKGSFETVFNKNKDEIILWLEELIPLQKQIELLYEKENIEFQKRNYTRILTKYLNDEYQEFVSVNILLRDLEFIKKYYNENQDLIELYNSLILNKHLKYPGKSEKYVEFDIFKEFVLTYSDDLEISNITIIKDEKHIDIKTNEEQIAANEIIVQKEEKTNWTDLLLGKKR